MSDPTTTLGAETLWQPKQKGGGFCLDEKVTVLPPLSTAASEV
jgi:hypothetical protein